MPFTSVLGASSVIKPGVCTSSTRPTAPYVGQLVFETDTNLVAAYTASGWVYGSFTGGLVLVKSQTISGLVSSVTVSSVFSSTYDRYLITTNGGAHSGGGAGCNLTLGSTTTGYYFATNYAKYTGTSGVFSGANTTSWQEVCYVTANGFSGSFMITNPFAAARTLISGQNGGAESSASFNFSTNVNGFLDNATSYTAFTLTLTGGTVTGGTIRVYGLANS
jgi:hypothetical protein